MSQGVETIIKLSFEVRHLLIHTRQQDPRLLICQEIVDDLDARQTRIVALGSLGGSRQDQEPLPLHRENMRYEARNEGNLYDSLKVSYYA